MSGTSTSPPSADRLRQEMRTIRRELSGDVEELVGHAERLMDWRYYLQQYPWASLGAAGLAGFFLVPGRTVISPINEQTINHLVDRLSPEKSAPAKKASLFSSLLSAGINMASRAALAYATQQVGKVIAAQSQPAQRPEVEVQHG